MPNMRYDPSRKMRYNPFRRFMTATEPATEAAIGR
jgi:hypothetical protein